MPLQATSGAASYDAFGGGVPVVPNYIEDMFSTYLYTGNGGGGATGFFGTQTITNSIDLSTKGGLVWLKARSSAEPHALFDTARGVNKILRSDFTFAQNTAANTVTAFNTTGFNLGSDSDGWGTNTNAVTYASWTFRKQPKFFDVVTITSGAGPQTISHNLGSTPGMIVVKRTTGASDWWVWHRSIPNNALALNTTQSTSTFTNPEYIFGDGSTVVQPTSTQFTFYAPSSGSNTYVAYLFAHNAGGFGLTGTDNVISCGSYTGNGSASGPTITLGYEPQWVLVKRTDSTSNWTLSDNMRGQPVDGATAILYPNASDAEASATTAVSPTATGFQVKTAGATYNASGGTYIYIAIRRGPMKVPTSGTSVFNPVLASSTAPALRSSNFTSGVDSGIRFYTAGYTGYPEWSSRLTGTGVLGTSGTAAESTLSVNTWDYMNGYLNYAGLGTDFGSWMFKRAPSFFDVVCDSTGGPTIYHNLGVAPQLIIAKVRNYSPQDWFVDVPALGSTRTLNLNLTGAASSTNYISSPTATQFTTSLGGGGYNYVYYLFATCAGVSKCTSFTGNGSSQTINCGFTGGARFVLIKRVDSTGNWVTFDTARGISSGNDPALYLNSTAAEVTGVDAIDPDSTGFIVNQESTFNLNVSSATYLVLAIA